MISVYQNRTDNNITIRDYEAMRRYIKLIQWGRRNPVQFIELVLGITLLDYQKWIIAESWTKEYVVLACSRNSGKTFLLGLFLMARNLLFPKLKTRIISENWTTCNDSFRKLEDIAMNNIKTIVTTNTVFIDELEKTKADSDGFTHDAKSGNKCKLLNGSEITAVAGSSRSARGKRSNVNVYDEAGFISAETYDVTEPYMSQTSEFKLGGYFDAEVYPLDIPNIRLYVGSASDTDSYFYAKYKDGTKRMLAGDSRYFVADLSCEIPMHPTANGIPTAPLLSQSEIDRKMRENEIAANREYYNIFDHFNLEDAVVTRSDIYTNTEVFAPVVSWGGKKHKYIIAYDPSSKVDNAPVLVMEVYLDESKQICGRCVHMENLFVTYGDGSKRPMKVEEQVKRLRELIYEYNGRDKILPYENVTVLIDNGIGGNSSAIAQALAQDWVDENGKKHPGIFDETNEFSVLWAEPYKKTCVAGCLRLLEPNKVRNLMFEAAKLLVPQGVIKFPPQCPKYDTLVFDDGEEKKLNKMEINSLIQMDLMKEEIISMVRIKSPTTGRITYQLPPDKAKKMHDDRNYVFIMCCYEIRRLRDDETYGDGVALDYSGFGSGLGEGQKNKSAVEDDPWLQGISSTGSKSKKVVSPWTGQSPFK